MKLSKWLVIIFSVASAMVIVRVAPETLIKPLTTIVAELRNGNVPADVDEGGIATPSTLKGLKDLFRK